MPITFSLEGLLKDEIAISLKGNHHILVAGSGLTGNRPVSLVNNLLSGWVTMTTWLEAAGGRRRGNNR